MNLSSELRAKLKGLPTLPGCYLFRDQSGQVIYVGKALSLRDRVRSYFHRTVDSAKTQELVRHIADLEYQLEGSELEALIRELRLIRQYRPKYNIRLNHDKRYPYVEVHRAEDFATVTVSREAELSEGSQYFGPYTSSLAAYQTLDILRRVFPYRTCDRVITGHDARSCLYHDIKLCLAPCVGACSRGQYQAMIEELCCFLEGQTGPIVARLRREMQQASSEMQYEKAAARRDQLRAVEWIIEKQRVLSAEQLDSDIVALCPETEPAHLQLYLIRAGKLLGRYDLGPQPYRGGRGPLEQFFSPHYPPSMGSEAPVLLPEDVEEARIISTWLHTKRCSPVLTLCVPRLGSAQERKENALRQTVGALQALERRRPKVESRDGSLAVKGQEPLAPLHKAKAESVLELAPGQRKKAG